MIADLLERWTLYFESPIWRDAFEFVQSLDADAEEKRYDLRGDDLFVIVAGYETKPPAEAVFEAHQRYIDIQTLLKNFHLLEKVLSYSRE
jgi:YhcH/YjgK/YiaL family protein